MGLEKMSHGGTQKETNTAATEYKKHMMVSSSTSSPDVRTRLLDAQGEGLRLTGKVTVQLDSDDSCSHLCVLCSTFS